MKDNNLFELVDVGKASSRSNIGPPAWRVLEQNFQPNLLPGYHIRWLDRADPLWQLKRLRPGITWLEALGRFVKARLWRAWWRFRG